MCWGDGSTGGSPSQFWGVRARQVTPKLCTTEAMPLTHEGLSSLHPLPQVAFNRGRFEGLPHKPTIAAKYVAIVATSRRLSFPACNETDASLTFPSFVERNVCFYGQSPLIRLNSREKRPNSRSPLVRGGLEGLLLLNQDLVR